MWGQLGQLSPRRFGFGPGKRFEVKGSGFWAFGSQEVPMQIPKRDPIVMRL